METKTYYIIDDEVLDDIVGNFTARDWFEMLLADKLLEGMVYGDDEWQYLADIKAELAFNMIDEDTGMDENTVMELVSQEATDIYLTTSIDYLCAENGNNAFRVHDMTFRLFTVDSKEELTKEQINLLAKLS
jgi:hypothetical protein